MTEIFLMLLNRSIAAGWLVLAVFMLRVLLRKMPKTIHCILWGLVAVRLLCPFSIESMFSLIPSVETIPQEIVSAEKPYIHSGITHLNSLVNPIISVTLAPTMEEGKVGNSPMQILVFYAVIIWIVGMFLLLSYGLFSYVRLYKKTKESVVFGEEKEANGIEYDKDIRLCDHISTPFILGVLHPRIFLPSDMDNADAKYVIAHERAHLKRRDHWWKPIGFVLLIIYWFQPLMWVAYVMLCRDIELACDERVIKDMGTESKKAYLETLIRFSSSQKIISACPLAFGEVGVEKRVRNVLHYRKPAFWIMLGALLACAVAAICFLTNPKEVSEEPDLSFLNYQNAISLVADREEIVAVYYPLLIEQGASSRVPACLAAGKDVATYLEGREWQECKVPWEWLLSSDYVQFIIEADYRITVYKRKSWSPYSYAYVKYGNESRYYRTDHEDYEKAAAFLKLEEDNSADLVEIGSKAVNDYIGVALAMEVEGIEYVYKSSLEPSMPRLTLSMADQRFTFSYSGFDSTLPPGGTFEITDNRLVLTEDNDIGTNKVAKRRYVFQKNGDHYVFDASRSSVIPTYHYGAGIGVQSPVPDGAVFEPIVTHFTTNTEASINIGYPPIIDSMLADIDGDGVQEVCTLSYGPTSGLFTFSFSVKEYGSEALEYFNIFTGQYYQFSFMVSSTGGFYLAGRTQGEHPETEVFAISIEKGNIVLSRDKNGEKISYWGEQGVNSKWAN